MIRSQEASTPRTASTDLAARIDAVLPQTQCTRCGYPDCATYAQAIADGLAAINQCPPGGTEGIARVAAITGHTPVPLSEEHGIEGPRAVAFIDEAWCIGCTLCIKACPTDAIVGSNKMMHTIIEPYCTGCELCIPVCPVDCIQLDNVTGAATGWAAWSPPLAQQARDRYLQHLQRIPLEVDTDDTVANEADNANAPAAIVAAESADARKAAIAAAMERARQRRNHGQI